MHTKIRLGNGGFLIENSEYANISQILQINSSDINDYSELMKNTYSSGETYRLFVKIVEYSIKSNIVYSNEGDIIFHEDDNIILSYGKLPFWDNPNTASSVENYVSTSNLFILVILGNISIGYTVYDFVTKDDLSVFQKNIKLNRRVYKEAVKGDVIHVNTFNQVISFESSQGNINENFILKLVHKKNTQLLWLFDKGSLRSTRPMTSTNKYTRSDVLLQAISLLSGSNSYETIEMFIDLKLPHYIRWEAMKYLILFDINRASKTLKLMSKKDPHPEVRKAAYSTIKKLEDSKILK